LKDGKVSELGSANTVIDSYLSGFSLVPVYYAPLSKSNALTPFISYLEVKTSNKEGVHEAGKELIITVIICHVYSIKQACLAVQIFNQYHQPIIHADAYYPDLIFADVPGLTKLVCCFKNLRLNVGLYYLKTYITGAPGASESYEVLDGICTFEVIRSDKIVSWGWRSDICAYYEDFSWEVSPVSPESLDV